MSLFNFKNASPVAIPKGRVQIFDRQIPLNFVKGRVKNFSIKVQTRYFDKGGNILRYGDGSDDEIVRSEKYKMLELYLKTFAYDSYMKVGHYENTTTLYFERDKLFDGFRRGDTISYFGLFLTEGASWTDYFIFNHTTKTFTNLYFPETINKYIFDNKLVLLNLTAELENKMKRIVIP